MRGGVGFDTMCSFRHTVCEGPLRPKGKYTIGYTNLGVKFGWINNQYGKWEGNNIGCAGIQGQLEEEEPEKINREENQGSMEALEETKGIERVSHQLGCFWLKTTENLNWFKLSRFTGPNNWQYRFWKIIPKLWVRNSVYHQYLAVILSAYNMCQALFYWINKIGKSASSGNHTYKWFLVSFFFSALKHKWDVSNWEN